MTSKLRRAGNWLLTLPWALVVAAIALWLASRGLRAKAAENKGLAKAARQRRQGDFHKARAFDAKANQAADRAAKLLHQARIERASLEATGHPTLKAVVEGINRHAGVPGA